VDKLTLDFFDLRFRVKLKDEKRRYLIVEKRGAPAGGWHLTIPLSPLYQGPDEGLVRPHLSRDGQQGNRRQRRKNKERRVLHAETLEPIAAVGAAWPGALKFEPDDVIRFFEERLVPMHAELDALAHYEENVYDDGALRRILVAVYDRDEELFEEQQRRGWERIERDGQVRIDDAAIAGTDEVFASWAADAEALEAQSWKPVEHLDQLAPGTREAPITVRLRAGCGHEFDTSIFRCDDGRWMERRYCCPGDAEKRSEIIDRHLGPYLRTAYVAVMRMLGFPEESAAE